MDIRMIMPWLAVYSTTSTNGTSKAIFSAMRSQVKVTLSESLKFPS